MSHRNPRGGWYVGFAFWLGPISPVLYRQQCQPRVFSRKAESSASAQGQNLREKTARRAGLVLDDELFRSTCQAGCSRPPGEPRLGLWSRAMASDVVLEQRAHVL